MKKQLLGAMMLLGSLAYAQGNQTIVPIDAQGNAETRLPVEVVGNVHDTTGRALVVEIESATSPNGQGFMFKMKDLFKGQTSEPMVGKFTAKVVKDGAVEPLKAAVTTKLVVNGEEQTSNSNIEGNPAGAATGTNGDGITTTYNLTGTSKEGDKVHSGSLIVTAKADGTKAAVGSYIDTSVALKVAVTNQKDEI